MAVLRSMRKALLKLLRKAGKGKVKRKEYLRYLANLRAEEFRMKDMGYRIVHKSVFEVRAEFEQKYGSIYVEI